jgi:2-amino-4-hydroxy-6-hydroxymethyldihydropteridine diphosphokinase
LGDRERHLSAAREWLGAEPHVRFLRAASIYETDPVGGPPQGKYLNTVWEIETDLPPRELLALLQTVESKLGRSRHQKNEARTIDLDILFYDHRVLDEPGLTIPHPRMAGRWFVLKPLWDLASELVHPVFRKSICEMLDACAGQASGKP